MSPATRHIVFDEDQLAKPGECAHGENPDRGTYRDTASYMTLDTSSLLWGLLFGSVGLGFFLYGKKQKAVIPLVCGLALMVLPYFVSNDVLLVLSGVALMVVPYFISI